MATRKTSPLSAVWHELYVDRSDATPPVRQIATAIRHKIATNRVSAGDTVPSVRALARLLGVTPATVARAYGLLGEESLLIARPGAGTVVADVEHVDQAAYGRGIEAAQDMLVHAVRGLHALGYDQGMIRDAIDRSLATLPTTRSVLVVGGATVVAEKYRRILEGVLGGLAITVEATDLPSLERGDDEAIVKLRASGRIVTLLSFQRAVEELARPFGVPVTVLLTEVTFDTLRRLESIPGNHQVLLVAEEAYRSVGIGMIRAYCPDDRLLVARDLDPAALRRTAARADTVVHTLGASDIVQEVVRSDQPALELEFQPRPEDLRRVTATLRHPAPAPLPTPSRKDPS